MTPLLLALHGALLDGQSLLVVLDVAVEACYILWGGGDADARVACEDNVLHIVGP